MARLSNRFKRRASSRRAAFLAPRNKSTKRGATRRAMSPGSLLRPALGPVLCILIPLLSVGMLKSFYFTRNAHFTLQHIVVHTGDTVSEASVREITGIERGMNLFDIDIAAIRRQYLAHAHHVRNLRMTRVLPDRLEIQVTERRPVARIGRRGDLVVDEQGLVFVRRGDIDMLPMLVGGRRAQSGSVLVVAEEPIAIDPGKRLGGNALAGIEALLMNEEPGFRLPVVEVDVSRLDHLVLILADQREIKLSWPGMGRGSARAHERLDQRLRNVMDTLSKPESRAIRYFDATVDDRHVIGR